MGFGASVARTDWLEAIGSCFDPDALRDKDVIRAAPCWRTGASPPKTLVRRAVRW